MTDTNAAHLVAPERAEAPGSKRRYQKPRLREYGSLGDLTAGNNGSVFDASPAIMTMM